MPVRWRAYALGTLPIIDVDKMNSSVFLLVLISAISHAAWNFAARKAMGNMVAVWLGLWLGLCLGWSSDRHLTEPGVVLQQLHAHTRELLGLRLLRLRLQLRLSPRCSRRYSLRYSLRLEGEESAQA